MPSPKDTKGPIVKSGPTRGENRSRNNDGEWRKKRSDTGKSRDNDKKSGCFITTAACEFMGYPDDCYELESLRFFRDSYLLQSEEGKKIISQYYCEAPDIAECLRDKKDLEYVWKEISECVKLIEKKDYNSVALKYEHMFNEVKDRLSCHE